MDYEYTGEDTIVSIGLYDIAAYDHIVANFDVMVHPHRHELVMDLLELGDMDIEVGDIFDKLNIHNADDLLVRTEAARFLRLFVY